jgi:hypothetical protein
MTDEPAPDPVDVAWRRLNARGHAEVHGGRDWPVVLWWPRGQRGNPFCQRTFPAPVLGAALIQAERETRPPTETIEWTRWRVRTQRENAARAAELRKQREAASNG